jgi:hypothetical protein
MARSPNALSPGRGVSQEGPTEAAAVFFMRAAEVEACAVIERYG